MGILNSNIKKGFAGAHSQWSRNFGVVSGDSSDADLSQYIVKISRIDLADKLSDSTDKSTLVDLGPGTLLGMMLGNVSYTLNAGWSTSDNMVSSTMQGLQQGIMGTVGGLGRQAGVETNSAGFVTRKVYRGGTDIGISIKLRLFDSTTNLTRETNDNGKVSMSPQMSVMDGVNFINSIMVPCNLATLDIKDLDNFATQIESNQRNNSGKTEAELAEQDAVAAKKEEMAEKEIQSNKDALATQLPQAAKILNTVMAGIDTDLNEFKLNLTASPPPIRIQIGQWFVMNQGVVTSASFDFSKEMSAKGPLYCDVTLQVTTRENIMLVSDKNNNVSGLNNIKLFGVGGASDR